MSEEMGKKITDLTENSAPNDEDLFLFGNAGSAILRKIKWSNILIAIKNKIAEWTFNDLNTTEKTLLGAVNELNSDMSKNSAYVRFGYEKTTTSSIGAFLLPVKLPNLNLPLDSKSFVVFATMATASTNRIVTSNNSDSYAYCVAVNSSGETIKNTEIEVVYCIVYKK